MQPNWVFGSIHGSIQRQSVCPHKSHWSATKSSLNHRGLCLEPKASLTGGAVPSIGKVTVCYKETARLTPKMLQRTTVHVLNLVSLFAFISFSLYSAIQSCIFIIASLYSNINKSCLLQRSIYMCVCVCFEGELVQRKSNDACSWTYQRVQKDMPVNHRHHIPFIWRCE